jgi:hypothetical protein
MFTLADTDVITKKNLGDVRESHDRVLAAMVQDLSMTRTRSSYTTDLVSLNAHAPIRDDIEGQVEDDYKPAPFAGTGGFTGHPITTSHTIAPYYDPPPRRSTSSTDPEARD